MKKLVSIFEILSLNRLNNSIYGNPRYEILVCEYHTKDLLTGKTESDGSIGYKITNFNKHELIKMEYHYTKSGNLIFERIID